MAEAFEFEVRPIEGATAAVGEEVTFKEEGGRLYSLNEDGEAFGVVPKATAARLEAAGIDSLSAEVASRADGIPTVSVEVAEVPAGDAAVQSAVAVATAAAAVEAAGKVAEPEVGAEPSVEPAPEEEPAAVERPPETPQGEVAAASVNSGAHFAQTDAAADAAPKKKSKTKYIAIAAVMAVVIVIIACVGLFSGEKTQTVTSDWLSIEVPEDWTVETLNEDAEPGDSLYCVRHIYSDEPGFYVYIGGPQQIDEEVQTQYEYDEVLAEWLYGAEKVDDFTIDDAVVQQYEVDSTEISLSFAPDDYELTDDSTEWAGYVYYVYSGTEYIVLRTFCLADEYDEDVGELEDILDSMVLEDASEPETVMQTVSDGEISIEVPAGWTVEDVTPSDASYDARIKAVQFDSSQMALLQTGTSLSGMENIYIPLIIFEQGYGLDSSTLEQSEYANGAILCKYDYSDEENGLAGYVEFVFSGDTVSTVFAVSVEDEFSENSETLETILDSLTIENPSEPDFS